MSHLKTAARVLAGALVLPLAAEAAMMRSDYVHQGGSSWTVDFTIVNDGAPASIAAFTVYFPHASFSQLVLNTSPTGWDSLVIQPDAALTAPGFLDAMALGASDEVSLGESQGGFRLNLQFAGSVPGALSFEIRDESFNTLFSGITVASAVPEPAGAVLASLGLLGLIATASRSSRNNRKVSA